VPLGGIIYETFDNLMILRVNARYTRLYLLTLDKYWNSWYRDGNWSHLDSLPLDLLIFFRSIFAGALFLLHKQIKRKGKLLKTHSRSIVKLKGARPLEGSNGWTPASGQRDWREPAPSRGVTGGPLPPDRGIEGSPPLIGD
jgi:hypothetical protein